jgi:transposase-like protein
MLLDPALPSANLDSLMYRSEPHAQPNGSANLAGAVLVGLQQKRSIIAQVIEGRMTLSEAAGRFQIAHQAASVCLAQATGTKRAADHESACRELIGWVYLTLADRPEYADRVSEKLESELRENLKRGQNMPPR